MPRLATAWTLTRPGEGVGVHVVKDNAGGASAGSPAARS
jgi:hypothetical protein